MNIDFVSSLTPDDETRIINELMARLTAMLDELPIAYSLRVKSARGEVFDHSHCPRAALDEAVHL
ncbi:MAG: hypothetical protein EHM13_11955 [Acidobacteria bacterium]|nr:MAG: hypothetical protein EHM13_11955 [Acidobacteriota bacterium]